MPGDAISYLHRDGVLQELHWFKQSYGSWFLGDYVCEGIMIGWGFGADHQTKLLPFSLHPSHNRLDTLNLYWKKKKNCKFWYSACWSAVADGSLYTATPVDPVFIFLPIFEEARMKVCCLCCCYLWFRICYPLLGLFLSDSSVCISISPNNMI